MGVVRVMAAVVVSRYYLDAKHWQVSYAGVGTDRQGCLVWRIRTILEVCKTRDEALAQGWIHAVDERLPVFEGVRRGQLVCDDQLKVLAAWGLIDYHLAWPKGETE